SPGGDHPDLDHGQHREHQVTDSSHRQVRIEHREHDDDPKPDERTGGDGPDRSRDRCHGFPAFPEAYPGEIDESGQEGDSPGPQQPDVAALDEDPIAPHLGSRDSGGRADAEEYVPPVGEFGEDESGQVLESAAPALRETVGVRKALESTTDDGPQGGYPEESGRNSEPEHRAHLAEGVSQSDSGHGDSDEPGKLAGSHRAEEVEQRQGTERNPDRARGPADEDDGGGKTDQADVSHGEGEGECGGAASDVDRLAEEGRVVAEEQLGDAEQAERLEDGENRNDRRRRSEERRVGTEG